jgi:hypothetical protein
MTGRETAATIYGWSEETFPAPACDPDAGRRAQALKLIAEAVELSVAVGCNAREIHQATFARKGPKGWDERVPDPAGIPGEIADVAIVLAVLAGRCRCDIGPAVDLKMQINRHKRKWVVTPDGMAQHVPAGAA